MIKNLYTIWCKYQKLVRRLSYVLFFFSGLFAVGPAVREPRFWEAINLINSDPWLRDLLDPTNLLLDPLSSALGLQFIVWGGAFAAYSRYPNLINSINKVLHFTSTITGATATILFNFVSILLGVATFATYTSGNLVGGLAPFSYWVVAMFFRLYKLEFVKNEKLDQHARHLALLFLVIAALFLAYDFFIEIISTGIMLLLRKIHP